MPMNRICKREIRGKNQKHNYNKKWIISKAIAIAWGHRTGRGFGNPQIQQIRNPRQISGWCGADVGWLGPRPLTSIQCSFIRLCSIFIEVVGLMIKFKNSLCSPKLIFGIILSIAMSYFPYCLRFWVTPCLDRYFIDLLSFNTYHNASE